jgi:putative membrane protein
MWVGGDGLMMILMLITVLQWVRAGQGDRGLGPWLEGIRRQATVGETSSNTTEIDVDDDAAAHDAYNARLAALNGLDRRHPDNSPIAGGHGS